MKSVTGSFRNAARAAASVAGTTLDRRLDNHIAPVSSGSRRSALTGVWRSRLAFRNDSFDVFSSNRRTRYAMPGSIAP